MNLFQFCSSYLYLSAVRCEASITMKISAASQLFAVPVPELISRGHSIPFAQTRIVKVHVILRLPAE